MEKFTVFGDDAKDVQPVLDEFMTSEKVPMNVWQLVDPIIKFKPFLEEAQEKFLKPKVQEKIIIQRDGILVLGAKLNNGQFVLFNAFRDGKKLTPAPLRKVIHELGENGKLPRDQTYIFLKKKTGSPWGKLISKSDPGQRIGREFGFGASDFGLRRYQIDFDLLHRVPKSKKKKTQKERKESSFVVEEKGEGGLELEPSDGMSLGDDSEYDYDDYSDEYQYGSFIEEDEDIDIDAYDSLAGDTFKIARRRNQFVFVKKKLKRLRRKAEELGGKTDLETEDQAFLRKYDGLSDDQLRLLIDEDMKHDEKLVDGNEKPPLREDDDFMELSDEGSGVVVSDEKPPSLSMFKSRNLKTRPFPKSAMPKRQPVMGEKKKEEEEDSPTIARPDKGGPNRYSTPQPQKETEKEKAFKQWLEKTGFMEIYKGSGPQGKKNLLQVWKSIYKKEEESSVVVPIPSEEEEVDILGGDDDVAPSQGRKRKPDAPVQDIGDTPNLSFPELQGVIFPLIRYGRLGQDLVNEILENRLSAGDRRSSINVETGELIIQMALLDQSPPPLSIGMREFRSMMNRFFILYQTDISLAGSVRQTVRTFMRIRTPRNDIRRALWVSRVEALNNPDLSDELAVAKLPIFEMDFPSNPAKRSEACIQCQVKPVGMVARHNSELGFCGIDCYMEHQLNL